jgi:hypothetical protein
MLSFADAQSGSKIEVASFQNVNLFAQNRIIDYADFPNETVAYQNVTMLLTMGCMNGDSCSHWDYDLDVYVGDSTGVMDSTVISIDTVSANPTVLDTSWNVFEIVEWHELGRYITPYGNYMNWNQNGFDGTWEQELRYDVTDFAPMLRGNTPIRIFFHGWQEGFRASVDFTIIRGNPTRDVVDIQNVYNGGGYTSFAQFDADRTPAKTLSIPADANEAKLRVIVTGHGQAGEFTPIDYTVKANGTIIRTEDIWLTCDEIAVSPQGGTWLLSRANWCPGDLVEIHEFELTDFIQGSGNNKTIDLDIDFMDYVPSAAASYSLSVQLITYETYRRDYDVLMEEIIAPSNGDAFVRFNPICDNPVVRIKNYGKQDLTYCEIEYWIDHTNKFYFDWNGVLKNGEMEDVELPNMDFTNLDLNNMEFFANVHWPNNLPDQFPFNNEMSSMFESPTVFSVDGITVRFRSNDRPQENAYTIVKSDGTIIADESSFPASTFSNNPLTFNDGCYVFEMTDYGDDWDTGDGLSWWLNTQNGYESAGFVEFRNSANNAMLQTFQRDFGGKLRFPFLINTELQNIVGNGNNTPSVHPATTPYTSPSGEEFLQVYDTMWISEDKVVFSTEGPTALNNLLENYDLNIYPNPSNGLVSISLFTDKTEIITVSIFNLLGEEVDRIPLTTNTKLTYQFNELSAGFYLFSFDIEGKKITKKISLFR